jgi:hypothetical protein
MLELPSREPLIILLRLFAIFHVVRISMKPVNPELVAIVPKSVQKLAKSRHNEFRRKRKYSHCGDAPAALG